MNLASHPYQPLLSIYTGSSRPVRRFDIHPKRRRKEMRKLMFILSALVVASMLLTACRGGAAPAPADSGDTAPDTTTDSGDTTEGPVEIRWFIGLGAGGNPEEVEKE